MTPRKLLNKLQDEATTEIGKARYEGALVMYELAVLKPMRKYYDTHREHNREYQREYHKTYRAKKKADAEQIASEVANME